MTNRTGSVFITRQIHMMTSCTGRIVCCITDSMPVGKNWLSIVTFSTTRISKVPSHMGFVSKNRSVTIDITIHPQGITAACSMDGHLFETATFNRVAGNCGKTDCRITTNAIELSILNLDKWKRHSP